MSEHPPLRMRLWRALTGTARQLDLTGRSRVGYSLKQRFWASLTGSWLIPVENGELSRPDRTRPGNIRTPAKHVSTPPSPLDHRRPILPIFLLLDVSASMSGGPINAVNAALSDLKSEMLGNPIIDQIARIAVITFSDEARTLIPLSDLAYTPIPEALVEGGTNFAAAFRTLHKSIDASLEGLGDGALIYRPIVFFVSDGAHQAREDWTEPLSRLRDPSWKYRPEIVAFGLGEASHESLQKIATRFAYAADGPAMHDQAREVMQATINSIVRTADSLTGDVDTSGLHVEAPPELFTALPALS